jgi:uncharacterized phage infection (PIP) family protein YhgE
MHSIAYPLQIQKSVQEEVQKSVQEEVQKSVQEEVQKYMREIQAAQQGSYPLGSQPEGVVDFSQSTLR